MANFDKPHDNVDMENTGQALQNEAAEVKRLEIISQKWGDRLDDFDLPCPLCKGELKFQGVTRGKLYEFAEGEPGIVAPLDVFPITFVCNLCGYIAEFDAELFNPAYLAQISGAAPERIAELMGPDFKVLLLLRGDERNKTILDLATAVAGQRQGDVIVINAAGGETSARTLEERVHHYRPAPGNPAPVFILRPDSSKIQEAVPQLLARQRCNLMMVSAKGWSREEEGSIVSAIKKVLSEQICDIALVFDRGFHEIDRILLATSGGPSAKVAAPYAVDLARAFDAELHLLYIASPDSPGGEEEGHRRIAETLDYLALDPNVIFKRHITVGKDSAQEIIDASGDYDLLLIGGSPRSLRGSIRLDTASARIARNSPATSVVVLAQQNQDRSWLSRLLGR
jgi:nucleotide-binding universal stress UspA family protein